MTPGRATTLSGRLRHIKPPRPLPSLSSIRRVEPFERSSMNDIELFLQLPITAQAACICFAACTSCLFVLLLFAPRRNCFFFRWSPETRFLALLVSPVLLIIWPIVVYLDSAEFDPSITQ